MNDALRRLLARSLGSPALLRPGIAPIFGIPQNLSQSVAKEDSFGADGFHTSQLFPNLQPQPIPRPSESDFMDFDGGVKHSPYPAAAPNLLQDSGTTHDKETLAAHPLRTPTTFAVFPIELAEVQDSPPAASPFVVAGKIVIPAENRTQKHDGTASIDSGARPRVIPAHQAKLVPQADLARIEPAAAAPIALPRGERGTAADMQGAPPAPSRFVEADKIVIRGDARAQRNGGAASIESGVRPHVFPAPQAKLVTHADSPHNAISASAKQTPAQTPTIQVTIGRIEVRTTTPAAKPSEPKGPSVARMSLEEYQRRRERRGGG